jgi:folate-binding protein YgfZ
VRASPLIAAQQSYLEQEQGERRTRAAEAQRPGAAPPGALEQVDAIELLRYGVSGQDRAGLCDVVAALGPVEVEYAALRRGAGLMDCPHRGTLMVRGAERGGFLNRMLTADLRQFPSGAVRPAFWLNRKGRVEADLLVVQTAGAAWIDLDIAAAAATTGALDGFIFGEDVSVADESERWHHLALHGPLALPALGAASGTADLALPDRSATDLRIEGAVVHAARRDLVGETGIEILVEASAAERVFERLSAADATVGGGRRRVRPVGWFAFNMARIEGGAPLFNIDFDTTSLPHETGVLEDRVSFVKGCYPGQEIVARTHNLGHPRQVLRGLAVRGDGLPEAGAAIRSGEAGAGAGAGTGTGAETAAGEVIGVVTSSTLSPLLGRAAIAFGMIRWAHATPGAMVRVEVDGSLADAEVCGLRFLPAAP